MRRLLRLQNFLTLPIHVYLFIWCLYIIIAVFRSRVVLQNWIFLQCMNHVMNIARISFPLWSSWVCRISSQNMGRAYWLLLPTICIQIVCSQNLLDLHLKPVLIRIGALKLGFFFLRSYWFFRSRSLMLNLFWKGRNSATYRMQIHHWGHLWLVNRGLSRV